MKRVSLIHLSKIEWTDYGVNTYYGCQHACRYCYAKFLMKRYDPQKFFAFPEPIENAVELAIKEVTMRTPGRIMFCTMTDPYQPIEGKLGLSRKVLEVLLESKHHILVCTKSSLVRRDFDLIRQYNNVEVGFTITALTDLPEWEPYALGNTKRIEALMEAHEVGVKTFVSVEPWIPGVTDPIAIIEKTKRFADRYIVGKLNYHGVPTNYYRERLPSLIRFLEGNNIDFLIKRELLE